MLQSQTETTTAGTTSTTDSMSLPSTAELRLKLEETVCLKRKEVSEVLNLLNLKRMELGKARHQLSKLGA